MDYESVCKKLIEKEITVGSCESLTGGLFASTISSIPGISKSFKGSIVTYSTLVKRDVLGISQDIIDKHGVVSYEVGYLMSEIASKILDVDLCVSFTGNAGPSCMEGKEVGLVYIGITYQGVTECHECHFDGSRNEIREKCVQKAFKLINEKIN